MWHRVDHGFLTRHSPTLADKMAGSTESGIQRLVDQLLQAIGKASSLPENTSGSESPPVAKPARVEIGYAKLSMAQDVHRYSLKVLFSLEIPPDQGRLRFLFLWPKRIRIHRLENIRKGKERRRDGIQYVELIVDWEERIFPERPGDSRPESSNDYDRK